MTSPRIDEWFQAARDTARTDLLARALMLGWLFLLLIHAATYLRFGVAAMGYPLSLDYGEGIVWQQALLIPGPRMYGDITHFPYLVFHYPPIYHLVLQAGTALGFDYLKSGRAVSFLALLVISALLSAITLRAIPGRASKMACVVGGTVACFMTFTYQSLQLWAVLMRVDMLAVALTTAGIYVAIIAGRRLVPLCVALFLFVLATYTKQTEIMAPISVLTVTVLVSRRNAIIALGYGIIIGGAALVALEISTAGGFLRHILGYNLFNRFTLRHLGGLLWQQRTDWIAVIAALASLRVVWLGLIPRRSPEEMRRFIRQLQESTGLRALAIVSLWIVLSSIMLVTAGKRGAYTNYFIEWYCIASVLIGMLAAKIWDDSTQMLRTLGPLAGRLLVFLLPILLIANVLVQPVHNIAIPDPSVLGLIERIRESAKPVFSEDMLLLMRAGKEVPIEPAIFNELAAVGIWDQQPFLNMLKDHAFEFVVSYKQDFKRFTPEMLQEIKRNYPSTETVGDFVVQSTARY